MGIRDGIRELLRGKDETTEYRYSYDQHRVPESRSHYGYPQGGSTEPRGEYRQPYGAGGYGFSLPVHELKVPMCCDKCQEKVVEELEELEGVQKVTCDQYKQKVTVTGHFDIDKALKKAEKAVKKKCEYVRLIDTSFNGHSSHRNGGDVGYPDHRASSRSRGSPPRLTRSNSHDRNLGRLPSFGKVTHYDGSARHQRQAENEPRRDAQRDYYSVRRMPSFNKHRHHDAEYVAVDDRESSREYMNPRDNYASVRRMPSFNKHRHHDAEYISMDNARDSYDYGRSFYETSSGNNYASQRNERPVYRSQVSFSKLPVTNPHYVKHIAY